MTVAQACLPAGNGAPLGGGGGGGAPWPESIRNPRSEEESWLEGQDGLARSPWLCPLL